MKLKNGEWREVDKDTYFKKINDEIVKIEKKKLIEKIRIKKFISEMEMGNF